MNRPVNALRGAAIAMRDQLSAAARQSERTLLLGGVLLASVVTAAIGFVLAQYYSINIFTTLVMEAQDCWLDWGMQIGRHCFSDHAMVVGMGLRPNPWDPYPLFFPWENYELSRGVYPPAAMVPHLLFGLPASWLGVPQLGLIGYLLALTSAVLSPAVWAARGARGLERVVVFVALGAAAIPAWAVIDRGNSVGFLAPVGLVFLVALRRQRWGLVAVMVILAALIKPQFAILAVALFAARQWRLGGITLGGVVLSNLAAYLLWPRDFPDTILQSIHNALHYGGSFNMLTGVYNASFGKGLLLIPDAIAIKHYGWLPEWFLHGPRYLIGYVVLLLVVASVVVLGQRIPPVMVGIALWITVSLFPAVTNFYYLVIVLPVAALVVRNPDGPVGSGIFDRVDVVGGRRRAVGVCVSLACVFSIAHIPVPGPPIHMPIAGQKGVIGVIGTTPTVMTTVTVAPILWLIALAAIIFSYARRPAPDTATGDSTTSASGEPTLAAASHGNRE